MTKKSKQKQNNKKKTPLVRDNLLSHGRLAYLVSHLIFEVHPFMHTVVVQQQITTELMKERYKKTKENKQKNKKIMHGKVNILFVM